MDDFIYAEPISAEIPEPATLAMLIGGIALLAWRLRRSASGA